MVFHEITEKAILEALQNTRAIDMNQVSAQETRRVLDRIIGYDLSGLARQVIGGGATGGRVQSPTLRKIVERERERIDLKAPLLSATAEINSNNSLSFDAKLIGINHKRVASGKMISMKMANSKDQMKSLSSQRKTQREFKNNLPTNL